MSAVEIDALSAKAISIVLKGLDEISRKLSADEVGEYHLDAGLRLSIDSHPQWEFRWADSGRGDWFVAVPVGGAA